MEFVILYLCIGVSAYVAYRNRRKVKFGVITTNRGKYGYAMGDYLQSQTDSFHGLDVTLPYTLANFYLDSHKDSKRRGPGVLYDASQAVVLEGDFNKYFRLFVPKDSAVLVLSVLSPDVMQTLIGSSERYDVELYDEHLRIISPKKVYNSVDEAQLLKAAQALVAELDQRAVSWQKGADAPAKLRYRKGATIKLLGHYLRRSRAIMALLVMLVGIVLSGLGLAFYYTIKDPNFNDPYGKGLVAGTLIYTAAAIIILAIPVVILGPIAWFLGNRSAKDVFPDL